LRWAPIFAAAFVASLTIRVFFELQDYGPESAIRHINEAIRDGDSKTFNSLRVKSAYDSGQAFMVNTLYEWYKNGVTMQVRRILRNGNEVRAVLAFEFPKGNFGGEAWPGMVWGTTWVVERQGAKWYVDLNKTATIFRDSNPPRYPPPY